MITYDKGLASLPDDIICEIFSLLDVEALKSCSLTGKALSCSAKPFLHRTLHLTRRVEAPQKYIVLGRSELEGLPTLGERGLLQHTRHLSIGILHPDGDPWLFVRNLDPHIQHLRTLTNLTSLKVHCLDVCSFNPKEGEYFRASFGTLQSLELVYPRGGHRHIIYFACQFPNLRDLKLTIRIIAYLHSMDDPDPHIYVKNSPPLDGTPDLQWGVNGGFDSNPMDAHLILGGFVALSSRLKFRTLKLSTECTSDNLQLLVNACAPTLECIELIGGRFCASFLHGECPPFTPAHTIQLPGAPAYPQFNFERHSALRKLEIILAACMTSDHAAGWISKMLSTITSSVFTKFTLCFPSFYSARENQARWWNSVDDALDRFSPRVDVTLVMRAAQFRVEGGRVEGLAQKYFPLMWKNGKVVLVL